METGILTRILEGEGKLDNLVQFTEGPLIYAIYQGIKRGIEVTYENECYRACLTLIYCGIDALAYLDMPTNQARVHEKDFIQWAERYLSPNLKNKDTQVTGEELYSARCAMVHTYGVKSPRTKSGSTRAIICQVGGQSIEWDATVHPDTLLLRLETLREAFFTAIDRFLTETYADKQKEPILEARLRNLLTMIPYWKSA